MENYSQPPRTGPPSSDDVPATGARRQRTAAPPKRPNSGQPKAGARWVRLLALCLIGCLIAGGFAGIAAYRLSRGAVSLSFVKSSIEAAVSAELGVNTFAVRDAELAWATSGLELQLVDVRVTEPNGALLLQAPRAVVGLSGAAALRGRLAMSRVALISPRLQAFYADDGTLSVKFAQSQDAVAPAAGGVEAAAAAAPPEPANDVSGPIDFVQAITTISAQARRREHATAYLQEIGLQHATLIVDNGRRKTIWKVPEVRIDLSHKASRSLISGRTVVESLTGPWSLDFRTAEADGAGQLAIEARIAGLNPRGLARQVVALVPFEQLDVPLDGEARFTLTSKGRVSAATFALKARSGQLLAGASNRFAANVEAGSISGSYDPDADAFKISEASLSVDRNRLDVVGDIMRAPVTSPNGQSLWNFQFTSTGGQLAPAMPEGAAVPVDMFRVRGQADPDAGRVELQELQFGTGGASISGRGRVSDLSSGGGAAGLEAIIAPMPISQFLALWPSTLQPDARAWLATHITRGQLNGGVLKIASGTETQLSLALDIGATEILAVKGGPPLDISRGTLRVEGGGIELNVPDASLGVEGRRLLLKGLRLTAVDTSDGSTPVAEIVFRVLGPLAAAVDIADREPLKLLRSRGITVQSPEGRLDGQIKLILPLAQNLQIADIRAQGRLRLTDGRLRQVVGPHDITGAKIDFEFSESAIDARGDFLLKGIPVKLAGQHFLNTTADKQSPLRLNLKLDDADRAQLGLDINDLVAGDVPIEITVGPDAKGTYQANLTGDLTKAELTIDAVAYRKPPGVPARVQFSPVKVAQGKTELRNFRIAGDTIATEGIITLGPDNKARELSFPEFSVNVITRLDVQGRLRPDHIWEVRAKGSTFDGRELFRELFNVQHQTKPVPKDKPGLDLTAEIDTVLGFSDTSLKDVRLTLQRRAEGGIEKTTVLRINAKHETGKVFEAVIRGTGDRKLTATSQDAGQIFKTVGFYPNAIGGRMSLEVALDASGAAERQGILKAENFAVLGDPVVSEVFQNNDGNGPSGSARKKVVRERIEFDWMALPFSVGCGQFVMNDMEIRGPLFGAVMRGKADFKSQRLQMGGTYVPLSGINSAIGFIPGIGQLLTGVRGEGIFGITFAVIGPMANPEVLINPLSGILPGILRETQQLAPTSYRITPCSVGPIGAPRPDAARASSAGPATTGRSPAAAAPRAQPPDVLSDWSSERRSDTKPGGPQR